MWRIFTIKSTDEKSEFSFGGANALAQNLPDLESWQRQESPNRGDDCNGLWSVYGRQRRLLLLGTRATLGTCKYTLAGLLATRRRCVKQNRNSVPPALLWFFLNSKWIFTKPFPYAARSNAIAKGCFLFFLIIDKLRTLVTSLTNNIELLIRSGAWNATLSFVTVPRFQCWAYENYYTIWMAFR